MLLLPPPQSATAKARTLLSHAGSTENCCHTQVLLKTAAGKTKEAPKQKKLGSLIRDTHTRYVIYET